jgi:heme oxygenase
MAELRVATREHHDRIERRVDLTARLASIEDYRGLLARLHGFYAPLEVALAAHAGDIAGLDFHGRRKASLLLDDIAALGGGEGPAAEDLPGVDSPERALGVLYVLEGSTLGGAVIGRMARERLGVTRERGASFFGAYGGSVGSRWRAFGNAVEDHTGGTAPAEMREAAIGCFASLEDWLCR